MSGDTIAISAEHYLWQSLYTRIYDLQTAHSSLGLTVSSSDIMCVVTAAIWPAVGDGEDDSALSPPTLRLQSY